MFKNNTIDNINHFYDNMNNKEYDEFVDLLIENKSNNINFLSIGKSFNVASHFADILKCINFNANVMETSKLLHGDIGYINSNDLIIIISNSGNTKELVNILNVIIRNKTPNNIILLTSNVNGKLALLSTKNVIISVKNEFIDCFDTIPTNSIMNYILFSNIILSKLINKLKLDDNVYKENHVSGNIGDLYKQVKDVMISKEKCSILSPKNTIKDLIIDQNKFRTICSVVIDKDKVVGLITYNNVRIYLEQHDELNIQITEIMNKNFYHISDETLYVKDIKKTYNIIPIIINNIFMGIYYL